jgi:PPOX class probable F420-dependent enzyme
MTDDAAWARLATARVGRLATTAPRIVPVTFALVGGTIVHAVDHKPKATRMLARLEDLRRDPRASLLVDHYEEDWSRLWWARLRGTARVLESGDERERALEQLAEKYDQYGAEPPRGPVLAIDVDDWRSWQATST